MPRRAPGPTVSRRLLGKRLRESREAAELSWLEASGIIGDRTDIRIRHYEAGRRVPKYEPVELLGRRYGLDDAAMSKLHRLREVASTRNRWARFGLSENATTYMGLEEDAAEERTAEHVIIPGMLQTEAYARRKFRLGGLAPEIVDRRVSARLLRQERLSGDDPLQLLAVISEAALRWCAHEPEAGLLQLEHLVDRGRWPNIEIRVLPFGVGLHAGMDGAWSTLRFEEFEEEGVLEDVLFVEDIIGGQVVDDPPTVTRLDTLFGELRTLALDPNDSLGWITQLADETRNNNK